MDMQSDLLGEVAASPDCPTQRVWKGKQGLVARSSMRVRRQVATGPPNHLSQNPTVVEVTVHPSTVQHNHSHGWVDDGQHLDEAALTSRLLVSTPSVGHCDRRRRNREARHRSQDLATPRIAFRREVQTLSTIWKHRAEGPV